MALTPSRKSAVSRSQFCSWYSRSVAACTAAARPRRNVSRVAWMASGADWAISVASADAASRTWSGRHELVEQSNGLRVFPGDSPPRVHHQRRLLLPEQTWQGRGQPEPRMETQASEIGREPRFGASDAKIGHDGEPQAGAHRRAVDRSHDRLGGAPEADRLLVKCRPRATTSRPSGPRLPRSAPAEKCLPSEHNRMTRQFGSLSSRSS